MWSLECRTQVATNEGPLSGDTVPALGGSVRPFYGLSGVFSVSPPGEVLYSATLTVGEDNIRLRYILGIRLQALTWAV